MTRWPVLLALPYIMTTSTTYFRYADGDKPVVSFSIDGYPCGSTKEMCEDLAEALNGAHERRTDQSRNPLIIYPTTPHNTMDECFKCKEWEQEPCKP